MIEDKLLNSSTPHRERGSSWHVVAVVLIAALSLLLLVPLMVVVRTAEYDEAIFLDVARNIQREGLPLRSLGTKGAFFFDHTPLYIYLLSLFSRHSHSGLFLARSATVLAALAAIALTYLFGLRINGRRTGVLAALLLAINPFFLVYAFFVRMEMFMLLALLLALYLVASGVDEADDRRLLLAGIAFAVAVLFKEFALVGAGVGVAYVLWQRRTSGGGLAGALLVITPALLALAGWAVWSWRLSPTTFAATMGRWFNSAVSSTAGDPRMGLTWTHWALQLGSHLLGPGLTIGLLLGLGQRVLRRGRLAPDVDMLLAYALVAIALSFATSLKEPRHLIGILPPVALITGNALVELWDWLRGIQPRAARVTPGIPARIRIAAATAVTALVFALAGPIRPPLLPRPPTDAMPWVAPAYAERLANEAYYRVLTLAGERVAAITEPEQVIAVVHQATVVAYYADRPYQMLYTLPMQRVMDALSKAEVLVWDAPTFPLLTGNEIGHVSAAVSAGFALQEVVNDDGRSVAIYRSKDKP